MRFKIDRVIFQKNSSSSFFKLDNFYVTDFPSKFLGKDSRNIFFSLKIEREEERKSAKEEKCGERQVRVIEQEYRNKAKKRNGGTARKRQAKRIRRISARR